MPIMCSELGHLVSDVDAEGILDKIQELCTHKNKAISQAAESIIVHHFNVPADDPILKEEEKAA